MHAFFQRSLLASFPHFMYSILHACEYLLAYFYYHFEKSEIRFVSFVHKHIHTSFFVQLNRIEIKNCLQIVPTGGYRGNEVQSKSALEWMAWYGKENTVRVAHARNGVEKKIGKWKVDGWVEDTNTVLEFNGCLVHGHSCIKDRSKKFLNSNLNCDEAYSRTLEKIKYIQSKGFNVVTMWECHWRVMKSSSSEIQNFVKTLTLDSQLYLNPRDALFGGMILVYF